MQYIVPFIDRTYRSIKQYSFVDNVLNCIFSPLSKRYHLGDFPDPPFRQYTPGDFLVITFYTPNIESYAKISSRINELYCERHGYRWKAYISDPLSPDRRHVTWDKLDHILHALENESCKYLFWIDSDAIFNPDRWDVGIDTIVEAMKIIDPSNARIGLCANTVLTHNTNTGTMMFINCEWTRNFLRYWMEKSLEWFAHEKYHEQSALDLILFQENQEVAKSIILFDPDDFNTSWEKFHNTKLTSKNRIKHYFGTSEEWRVRKFNSILNEIESKMGRVI
jgi:hypothetical protein